LWLYAKLHELPLEEADDSEISEVTRAAAAERVSPTGMTK
jgi:hypothetical protein